MWSNDQAIVNLHIQKAIENTEIDYKCYSYAIIYLLKILYFSQFIIIVCQTCSWFNFESRRN